MTTDERVKFDKLLADLGLNEALGSKGTDALIEFISDVSDAAFQRGIDAEAYSNAVATGRMED